MDRLIMRMRGIGARSGWRKKETLIGAVPKAQLKLNVKNKSDSNEGF
jgi:hypothetical protein